MNHPADVNQAFIPAPQPPVFDAAATEPAEAGSEDRPDAGPTATAPQPAVAICDDVKVAGPDRFQAAPAGDTLGLPPVESGPGAGGADAVRDEIASGEGGDAGPSGPRPSGERGGAGRRNGMRIAAVVAGAAVVLGGGTAAAFALTGGSQDETTVKPSQKLADAEPKVDPRVLEEQRRKLALERAAREAREYDGKKVALRPKGTPLPTKTPKKKDSGGTGAPIADPVPASEAQRIAKNMMPSFGFTGAGEFGCLVKLWNKESGWRVNASNPSSGAYGIPQANPGTKMASAGPDWRTNPATQIKWGLGYIKGRYGTPCKAWAHSQSTGWY
ncbi:MAG TPA: transglycosylase SLT domain-containing protein [Spirillospora sp.]